MGRGGRPAASQGFTLSRLRLASPGPEAEWIAPRLLGFSAGAGFRVGNAIPDGYARYLRLFHPASAGHGDRISWRQVAARCGTRFHPLAQFGRLVRSCGTDIGAPLPGVLPAELVGRLAWHLGRQTGNMQCWAAYWRGWGALDQFLPLVTDEEEWTAAADAAASFQLPEREYLMLTGPLDAIVPPFGMPAALSPQLCWPQDRAWFFATEVDFDFTLAGADDDLAAALLGDVSLEVAEVGWRDRVDDEGDRLN